MCPIGTKGTKQEKYVKNLLNHPPPPALQVVIARNLVSDSNVWKHIGFFRENKKA